MENDRQSGGASLGALFIEFFKIALFVVGGGYAIIAVADDIFGRRLKWLKEGELIDHLPVFQMIPGLIAGNTAIYVGLKTAGRIGAVVALAAVALPSFMIFLGVSCGYNLLPADNEWLAAAFLGLRSALTGIIFATLAKGWKRSVRGAWGYTIAGGAAAMVLLFGCSAVAALLAAMCAGLVRTLVFRNLPSQEETADGGIALSPVPRRTLAALLAGAALAAAALWPYRQVVMAFAKFGLLGFGGGFVLVPVFMEEFVGPAAPLLQMSAEEFSNLIALTQMTPGPVSVNAATFFGFRLGGAIGAAVATAALLAPSYFLLSAALGGIARWRSNRIVQGVLCGVKPATNALMLSAGVAFAGMSVFAREPRFAVNPLALAVAAAACAALLSGKIPVMRLIFASAAAGIAGRALGIL